MLTKRQGDLTRTVDGNLVSRPGFGAAAEHFTVTYAANGAISGCEATHFGGRALARDMLLKAACTYEMILRTGYP